MDINSVWPACPSCRRHRALTGDERREVAADLYRIECDFSSLYDGPVNLEGRPAASYLTEDEAEEIRTESLQEHIRWYGHPNGHGLYNDVEYDSLDNDDDDDDFYGVYDIEYEPVDDDNDDDEFYGLYDLRCLD